MWYLGAWGGVVVKPLRYFGRSRDQFSVVSLDFSVTYFLPTAPWPRGSIQPLVKMSIRNIPGGKGGRCVMLTSPPSCAECHEKSGNLNLLEPSGPHRACYGTPLPLPVWYVIELNMGAICRPTYVQSVFGLLPYTRKHLWRDCFNICADSVLHMLQISHFFGVHSFLHVPTRIKKIGLL